MTALATLLLIAPIAEEAVFRGGLQEALLKRFSNVVLVNLATACIFALTHAVAHRSWWDLSVFLPALLVGAVYTRWRRLGPCVALHAFLNALWLGWGWMQFA